MAPRCLVHTAVRVGSGDGGRVRNQVLDTQEAAEG